MKFLVLALALCSVNAASYYPNFGGQRRFPSQSQVPTGSIATASASVNNVPVFPAAKVAPAPVKSVNVVPNPVYVPKNVDTNEDIVEQFYESRPDGGYASKYVLRDGTAAESVGTLKKVDDKTVITVSGSYRYINEFGEEVLVNYIADENGFSADSPIIPTGPPVPKEILESLEFIARNAKYVEQTKKL